MCRTQIENEVHRHVLCFPYRHELPIIDTNPDSSFRAIIVDADPVGLVASCALAVSGIDIIMLERDSNINPETGAGQALLLHTLHYFHRKLFQGSIGN